MTDNNLQGITKILNCGYSPMLFLDCFEKEHIRKQLKESNINYLTVSTEKENRNEDCIFNLSFADKYNSEIKLTSDLSIYNETLENAIIDAMDTTCSNLTRQLSKLILRCAIEYLLLENEKLNYNAVLRTIDNLCEPTKREKIKKDTNEDSITNGLTIFKDSLLKETHDTLVPYLEELSNYEYLPLRKLELSSLERNPIVILIIKPDIGNNYICEVIRGFSSNNGNTKQNIVIIQ